MADNLTPAQRSHCMSRVRNRDTDLERILRSALHRRGLRFRKHVRPLPGTPDIVFPSARVAVFVDGDFWHGYRFSEWADTLSPFWKTKIAVNRSRDQRNFRRLRRMGWLVIRVWQHELRCEHDACAERVWQAVMCRQFDATDSRPKTAQKKGPGSKYLSQSQLSLSLDCFPGNITC